MNVVTSFLLRQAPTTCWPRTSQTSLMETLGAVDFPRSHWRECWDLSAHGGPRGFQMVEFLLEPATTSVHLGRRTSSTDQRYDVIPPPARLSVCVWVPVVTSVGSQCSANERMRKTSAAGNISPDVINKSWSFCGVHPERSELCVGVEPSFPDGFYFFFFFFTVKIIENHLSRK